MNPSLRSLLRQTRAPLLAASLLCPLGLGAAWQLVDDFQNYTPGAVVAPWVAHNATGLITVAADGGNNLLAAGWANGHRSGSRPLAAGKEIAPGAQGTFFTQFRLATGVVNASFGLASNPPTDSHAPFDSFLAEVRVQNVSGVINLQVRDGETYQTVAQVSQNVWYSLWYVIDRTDGDRFHVYLRSDASNAGPGDRLAYQGESGPVDSFAFRNPDPALAANSVLVASQSNPNQSVQLDNLWIDNAGQNLTFTGIDFDGWQTAFTPVSAPFTRTFGTGAGQVNESFLLRRRAEDFTLQSQGLRLQPTTTSFSTSAALAVVDNYVSRQNFTVQSDMTFRQLQQVGAYRVGLAVLAGPHTPVTAPFDSNADSGFYGLMWLPAETSGQSTLQIRVGFGGVVLAETQWTGLYPTAGNPMGGINSTYRMKADGVYDETGALTLTFTLTDVNGHSQSVSANLLNPIQGNLFGIGGRLARYQWGDPLFDFENLSVTLGGQPGPVVADPALLAPFTANFGSGAGRNDGANLARTFPDEWSLQPQSLRLITPQASAHNSLATTRIFNLQADRDFHLASQFVLPAVGSVDADARAALILWGNQDRNVFSAANDSTYYTAQWIMNNAEGGSLVIRQGMNGAEIARTDFSALPNPPQAEAGANYRLEFYAFGNGTGGFNVTAILVDSSGGRAVASGSMATVPAGNRFGFGVRHRAANGITWDLARLAWTYDPLFLDFVPLPAPFALEFGTGPGQLGLQEPLPLHISQRFQDWSLQSNGLRITPGGASYNSSAAVTWVSNYKERQDFFLESNVTVHDTGTDNFQRLGFVVLGGPWDPSAPFSVGTDAGYYSVSYFVNSATLQIRNGLNGSALTTAVPWTGVQGDGATYTLAAAGEYDETGALTLSFTMTDINNHSQTISAVIEVPVTGNLFGPGLRNQSSGFPSFTYHNFSVTLGDEPEPPADPAITWPFNYRFGSEAGRDGKDDFAQANAAAWSLQPTALRLNAPSSESGYAVSSTRVANLYQPGIDFVLRSEVTLTGLPTGTARAGLVLFGAEDLEVFDPSDPSSYVSFNLEGTSSLVVRRGFTGQVVGRTDLAQVPNAPVLTAGGTYVLRFVGTYVDEGANVAFRAELKDSQGRVAAVEGVLIGPLTGNRFGFGGRHMAGESAVWDFKTLSYQWHAVPKLHYNFTETVDGNPNAVRNLGTRANSALSMLTSSLQATNLLGAEGSGVSGLPHDRALDFTSSASMGGVGPVGRGVTAFNNELFQSFTASGWFKTAGATPISNSARIFDFGGGSMQVFASQSGSWTIQVGPPTATIISDPVYTATEEWVFLAVSFDGVAGRVNFYIGTRDQPVELVQSTGVTLTQINTSRIQIGNNTNRDRAFHGLLDDIRFFALPTSGGAALGVAELEAIRQEAVTGPAVPPPPSGVTFAEWQATQFTAGELADAGISGPSASPAGDGIPNLLKYAFGFDARTPVASRDLVVAQRIDGALRLVYPERVGAQDIEYTPEVTTDLVSWSSGPAHVVEVNRVDEGDGFELVTVEAVLPEAASRGFIRVNVSQQ